MMEKFSLKEIPGGGYEATYIQGDLKVILKGSERAKLQKALFKFLRIKNGSDIRR